MTPADLLVGAAGLFRQAGGDDVPAEVRRIMSRPAYRYEPSLLERVGRQLGEWLQRLLERLDLPGVGAGQFGGGAGTVVAWVLIVLAVLLAVAAVVQAARRRLQRETPDATPSTTTEVEHERRAADWADEALRMERDGRFKDAVRARYRELVRTLVDRDQLPDVPGLTTGELRRALAGTTPQASAAFDRACTTFELAWYAELPVGVEDLGGLRDACEQVLAAPRSGPSATDRQDDGVLA
ncbi:MAG: DUF4129 domain-containing protein [Actinomycetes bacterium]